MRSAPHSCALRILVKAKDWRTSHVFFSIFVFHFFFSAVFLGLFPPPSCLLSFLRFSLLPFRFDSFACSLFVRKERPVSSSAGASVTRSHAPVLRQAGEGADSFMQGGSEVETPEMDSETEMETNRRAVTETLTHTHPTLRRREGRNASCGVHVNHKPAASLLVFLFRVLCVCLRVCLCVPFPLFPLLSVGLPEFLSFSLTWGAARSLLLRGVNLCACVTTSE